jgi:hypothetical protein
MKYLLSSKFVLALMLLTAVKSAIPMVASMTSPTEDMSFCLMAVDDNKIVESCHNSETAELENCCFTGCDHKYTPAISSLGSWQHVSGSIPVNLIATHLYNIYSQPVTPPPIQA